MKCPNCGYQHSVKLGMNCKSCRYRFVFNPKARESYQLTDGKFLAYLQSVSQNGTAYFTRNQLYANYCRRLKPVWIPQAIFGAVAAFLTFVLLTKPMPFALLGMLSAAASGVLITWAIKAKPRPLAYDKFMRMVDRWIESKGNIAGLIDGPSLQTAPPDWTEKDIYDYGVERILIVQRDELVDLFVLNNLHAEQRMLVISEAGYPNYLLPIARRLLEERLTLPVFLLHDAGPFGEQMAQRLDKLGLPLQNRRVIDLGFSSQDFQKMKRLDAFDRGRQRRDLPADALATPLLVAGVAACFVQEVPLSTLLAEQTREAALEAGYSSFG